MIGPMICLCGKALTMVAAVVATTLMLQFPSAQAGCTRDLDCQGARTCDQGHCVSPPQNNEAQNALAPDKPEAAVTLQASEAATAQAQTIEPAQGQTAGSEETGRRLFKAGKYAEAAAELDKAYRANGDPAQLYNMAQCYRLLGDTARALSLYQEYLVRMPESQKRPEVEARIEQLRADQGRGATVVDSTSTSLASTSASGLGLLPSRTLGFGIQAAPIPFLGPSVVWNPAEPLGLEFDIFVAGGMQALATRVLLRGIRGPWYNFYASGLAGGFRLTSLSKDAFSPDETSVVFGWGVGIGTELFFGRRLKWSTSFEVDYIELRLAPDYWQYDYQVPRLVMLGLGVHYFAF